MKIKKRKVINPFVATVHSTLNDRHLNYAKRLNRPVEKRVKYFLFYAPLSITAHTVIKYTSSTEISTNFNSTSISITADFVCPTAPDYEESVQTIVFTTSDKFEE